jgi:hypothetical protein
MRKKKCFKKINFDKANKDNSFIIEENKKEFCEKFIDGEKCKLEEKTYNKGKKMN